MSRPSDPYLQASYIPKLKETKTIFLTDLDGTHATRLGSLQELKDRAAVRQFVEERGFVAGAVTARTPALTMSSSAYEASVKLGFNDAPPRCGLNAEGGRVFVPLEELPFFQDSLDWDVVAALGSGVFPRNGHGYLLDRDFGNLLKYDYTRGQRLAGTDELMPWREAALLFLLDWPWVAEHFSPLEFSQNYHHGITDVLPLPYRIQLGFEGSKGLERMREVKAIIDSQVHPIAARMVYVDESKPCQDPERCKYTLYLMPYASRKERMINHLVSRSANAAGMSPASVKVFYAGDTPTDLRAGLYAGGESLTFLLATGSPLVPFLIERRQYFGDEPLDFLWESDKRSKRRFVETGRKGVYTFSVSGRKWSNTIVIGDVVYPGLTPPGSVRAFLEEFAKPSAGL